jgi:hypothetical protein
MLRSAGRKIRTRSRTRSGAAAAEAAVVLSLVVVPMMIGVWEMGRLVHAQQVVSNAAREGARLAAQARTINPAGAPTEISWTTGSPNVTDTVYQALVAGGLRGLDRTDVTTTCEFIAPIVKPVSSDPDPVEPYQAHKNQRFRITVSVPFAKVRWVNLGIVNPTTVSYTVDWYILVDDPFTVNVTIPNW